MDNNQTDTHAYLDFLVFALVPAIVGILIITSWALSYFRIAPDYVNGGLALVATLFGGYTRLLSGFRDCSTGRSRSTFL